MRRLLLSIDATDIGRVGRVLSSLDLADVDPVLVDVLVTPEKLVTATVPVAEPVHVDLDLLAARAEPAPQPQPPAEPLAATDDETHACAVPGCGKTFDGRHGLLVHHARMHKAPPPVGRAPAAASEPTAVQPAPRAEMIICPEPGCGQRCVSREALRSHQERRHNPARVAGSHAAGKYDCKDCPARFVTVQALGRHRQDEHPNAKGESAMAGPIIGSLPRAGEAPAEMQDRLRHAAAQGF